MHVRTDKSNDESIVGKATLHCLDSSDRHTSVSKRQVAVQCSEGSSSIAFRYTAAQPVKVARLCYTKLHENGTLTTAKATTNVSCFSSCALLSIIIHGPYIRTEERRVVFSSCFSTRVQVVNTLLLCWDSGGSAMQVGSAGDHVAA